jgi:hypothetical protein
MANLFKLSRKENFIFALPMDEFLTNRRTAALLSTDFTCGFNVLYGNKA